MSVRVALWVRALPSVRGSLSAQLLQLARLLRMAMDTLKVPGSYLLRHTDRTGWDNFRHMVQ